jgi:alkylhydroperoxidase/carboxymuconolactone decarboxylase family protein YurZ
MSGSRYGEELALLGRLGAPGAIVDDLDVFSAATLGDGVLPRKLKELAAAFAYADKGRDEEARRHGEAALQAGITRPETIEAMIVALLSRGFGVMWQGLWIAERAPEGEFAELAGGRERSTDEIVEYFGAAFNGVPPWLDLLAQYSPETLDVYYRIRNEIMRDGALPRRFKELMLVIVNTSERWEIGIETHVKGALAAGASHEEVLEAVRAGLTVGGMVGWIPASQLFHRIVTEPVAS